MRRWPWRDAGEMRDVECGGLWGENERGEVVGRAWAVGH
jgi:hypothetical protein